MSSTGARPLIAPKSAAVKSFIDPAALMRIRNLELRARAVVEGFLTGLHRSPYHGFSVEFTEYRQYSPGDDLRFLDWRRMARTDRQYIKRFEDETNLRCWLLVDLSRSMGYGTLEYVKAAYARTAAATIAYFLSLQRDAVGLMTFDDALQGYLPARYRPGHLHRLMMTLDRAPAGKGTSLSVPLEQVARLVSKRGVIVLLSDLLAPVESLETQLRYVRSRGHEVVVLRVLDPSELTFEFEKPALFQDVETDRELYIDPTLMRDSYLKKFEAHKADLLAACNRLGVDYYELPTNVPLEFALYDLLSSRLKRGRQVTRRSGPSARASSGRGR
jgi:uncharacterized protein (DUF58 family)